MKMKQTLWMTTAAIALSLTSMNGTAIAQEAAVALPAENVLKHKKNTCWLKVFAGKEFLGKTGMTKLIMEELKGFGFGAFKESFLDGHEFTGMGLSIGGDIPQLLGMADDENAVKNRFRDHCSVNLTSEGGFKQLFTQLPKEFKKMKVGKYHVISFDIEDDETHLYAILMSDTHMVCCFSEKGMKNYIKFGDKKLLNMEQKEMFKVEMDAAELVKTVKAMGPDIGVPEEITMLTEGLEKGRIQLDKKGAGYAAVIGFDFKTPEIATKRLGVLEVMADLMLEGIKGGEMEAEGLNLGALPKFTMKTIGKSLQISFDLKEEQLTDIIDAIKELEDEEL